MHPIETTSPLSEPYHLWQKTLLYAAALFISAGMFFWLEPMLAKKLLPFYGGSPQVWIVAMMYYQGVVLVGYTLAHLLTRYTTVKLQQIAYAGLLILSGFYFPIHLPVSWVFSSISPEWDLLKKITQLSIAPLILFAITPPLFQYWYGLQKSSRSHDPYFLYVASNSGSLVALLMFTYFLEPNFSLSRQAMFIAYLYPSLIAIAVVIIALQIREKTTPPSRERTDRTQVTFRKRAEWALLSFVPSSLLLGLTTHITSDLAPVPLLWLLPLALYLVTFIIAFSRQPWFPYSLMYKLLLGGMLSYAIINRLNIFLTVRVLIEFHASLFFITALTCHQLLADRRPRTEALTDYYLMLALGGFLGGVFNSLVAPLLFKTPIEYPLILILALMLNGLRHTIPARWYDWGSTFAIAVGILTLKFYPESLSVQTTLILNLTLILLCITLVRKPILLGLALAPILIVPMINPNALLETRNFFGPLRVEKIHMGGYNAHRLTYGQITHGIEIQDPTLQKVATTYYGAIEDAFLALRHNKSTPLSVATFGLGAGTLACLAGPHDVMTFYEINPAILSIAQDRRYFHQLDRCPPKGGIILGDARLKIALAPEHHYDLIILDAFNGDAIPVHLLTYEAFQNYLTKLKPHGMLAVHISNRYIDLLPVLKAHASDFRLRARMKYTLSVPNDFTLSSVWVVLARNTDDLGDLAQSHYWDKIASIVPEIRWTDDYSSVLPLFK